MKKILLIAALAFLAFACSDNKNPAQAGDSGPAISLSRLGDSPTLLGKVSVTVSEAGATADVGDSMFLDTVYSTQEYLFIPNNKSDVPLRNVKITSSNPGFVVQPSTIGVLDLPGEGSMIPILKVIAVHGTAYNKVGTQPYLWDGLGDYSDVSTTITFTWDGASEPVEYKMTVAPKIAHIVAAGSLSGKVEATGTDSIYVVGNLTQLEGNCALASKAGFTVLSVAGGYLREAVEDTIYPGDISLVPSLSRSELACQVIADEMTGVQITD